MEPRLAAKVCSSWKDKCDCHNLNIWKKKSKPLFFKNKRHIIHLFSLLYKIHVPLVILSGLWGQDSGQRTNKDGFRSSHGEVWSPRRSKCGVFTRFPSAWDFLQLSLRCWGENLKVNLCFGHIYIFIMTLRIRAGCCSPFFFKKKINEVYGICTHENMGQGWGCHALGCRGQRMRLGI